MANVKPHVSVTKMVSGRQALEYKIGPPFHVFMLELERALEEVWDTLSRPDIKPDRVYRLRLTIVEENPQC